MQRYTLYCTEEQTRKAFELGAPIQKKVITCWYTEPWSSYEEEYEKETDELILPTAEQMIGWLEEQTVLIQIYHEIDWLFSINHFEGVGRFSTRKEATVAAINAALDYLINN